MLKSKSRDDSPLVETLEMVQERVEGRVIRVTGGDVWVDVDGRFVSCAMRGRLRRKDRGVQIAAGDSVMVSLAKGGRSTGAIEEILPRDSWLSRFAGGRVMSERLIVANIDRVFVVASLYCPPARYEYIDRVLVAAEYGQASACVCLNKIDLVEDEHEIERFTAIYASCGYPVVRTSALTGQGVDALEKMLEGGIYAFAGESGVGKSSLLMKMNQQLDLKVRAVAEKTGRGRHTTSYSQLFPIRGGYMADTPGIQSFGFPGTEKEGLPRCFPEFRKLEDACHFQPCTHSHEPKCAIKQARDEGRIYPSRYESYLGILFELEAREKRKSY